MTDQGLSFQCPDEVARRLSRLYGDERTADVSFAVSHGDSSRSFLAHRSLVSAWSEPLEAMLCGGFAERMANEVRIQDVEPNAFEVMLKLIYTGVAEISPENVLSVLDVAVRFDVAPLVQFSVQFLQNHATSEHSCRMLEIGVRYHLEKLVDKCIELIVTDDHILESEDFQNLSEAAMVELAKHEAWNMHEDEIFEVFARWSRANDEVKLLPSFLDQLRFTQMSTEKLKKLSLSGEVPSGLLFEALFWKLGEEDGRGSPTPQRRPRRGSLLFAWVPSSRVTVSGELRESARHTSANGFTGVRGDRRMRFGTFSWTVDVAETQSSWIFVGVVQADDPSDVAWRASGHMLYCLDSRFFRQGSGQNHPAGDRKIVSGDRIRVVIDCTRHTLAFGVNDETPTILFHDLEATWYVPAVDLRDCGDKVRILSSRPATQAVGLPEDRRSRGGDAERDGLAGPERIQGETGDDRRLGAWEQRRHTVQSSLETVPAYATRLSQPRQFGSASATVSTGSRGPSLASWRLHSPGRPTRPPESDVLAEPSAPGN